VVQLEFKATNNMAEYEALIFSLSATYPWESVDSS
jgi:ribonuclease HI